MIRRVMDWILVNIYWRWGLFEPVEVFHIEINSSDNDVYVLTFNIFKTFVSILSNILEHWLLSCAKL